MTTTKQIKKMAEKYNCDFYKTYGYFYFSPRTGSGFYEAGVYTTRINDLTLAQWEKELVTKLKDSGCADILAENAN